MKNEYLIPGLKRVLSITTVEVFGSGTLFSDALLPWDMLSTTNGQIKVKLNSKILTRFENSNFYLKYI